MSTSSHSKPKRGLRTLFRDSFGNSSSRRPTTSTTSQQPGSQASVSSGVANELHPSIHISKSTPKSPPTGSLSAASSSVSAEPIGAGDPQHIQSRDEAGTSGMHAAPSATGKRPTNLQPASELTGVTTHDTTLVSTSTNSLPNTHPTSKSTDRDIPITPGPEHTATPITNPVWVGLKTSLQGLKDNPGVFSSLSVAAGTLLECCEGIEAAARNQQDYEGLARDLTTLSESLKDYFKPPKPAPLTKCIFGITIEIEHQAKHIKSMMGREYAGSSLLAQNNEDVIRRYRRIDALFRQLQINLSAGTWNIATEHLVNTRLEALNPVKQATYDSTLASTINRRSCTEGTRIEVLSNLDMWVGDPAVSTVCWMNGMAGTGKTTIACTFAGLLEDRKLLAASFFCTRTTADCRNPARIIPSIAYQLARYSAPFQTSLYEVLGDDPDMGAENIQKQFERLIRDPLEKAKDAMPNNLVVVIDALDECDDREGVETILDMLFRYGAEVPLKFFVTSRPEPEIYERMSTNAQSRAAFHLHDIEASLVQADIGLYLKEELAPISPTAVQLQELARRTGSLFVYAATLVRYIRYGKRFTDPRQRLQSVLDLTPESAKKHAEIDALYTAILSSALEEVDMEQKEAEDVKLVLRTVLFAQEPISVEAIAALAGLDDAERVSFALQPLRSVLHQSETTGLVSTLHASFPEFTSSQDRTGKYFCEIIDHGQQLGERCLGVLKEQLRFNICDLESSFVPDEQVEDLSHRIKNVSPTLAYACRYWGSHVALAPRSDGLLKALEEFVCDQLLFWMEVLSVQKELSMGIEALVKAKKWLSHAGSASSNPVVLLEDARDFITSFASSPASHSTPHIYISALPFCPRSSSVYKNYWKHTRGLLELKGSLMERREGAALATWNIGSDVNSVAYSRDGTRVAVGCDDGTVRMLNAHDGMPLVDPLKGHTDYVNSVAFSPDGKLVASGSDDGSIRVWNASNGTLVTGPFAEGGGEINSITFSPDGTRILSGSSDGKLRIWNTNDGTLLQGPFEGHTYSVRSVAFSPDGTLIASGSNDHTVRLWNSVDGTPAASPLEGHTHWVMSVAFTPDGTRLVSGSYDKTIRVWNVSDGLPVRSPFEGHTDYVHSVAVSPDGTRVASGSGDYTVRVWNIDDGTLNTGPFVGHTSRICSVAYSPDGTRVISGADDWTIRVWNVREGLLPPPFPFQEHMMELRSCMLSENGTRLLSSSTRNDVWVWDITSEGIVPSPLEGPYADYDFLRPSSATGYFTAFAADYSFQVMNTDNLTDIIGPFKGHTKSITSLVFSLDNTLLVTGSDNCTVRVWDLKKVEPLSGPFRGHAERVTSVAISPDCSRVMSLSTIDKTIRVWNTRGSIIHTSFFSPPIPSSQPDPTHSHTLKDWKFRKNGWVVNGSSDLLFWIPLDFTHNHAWPFLHTEFIICKDGVLHIPKQEVLIGSHWSRCYITD